MAALFLLQKDDNLQGLPERAVVTIMEVVVV